MRIRLPNLRAARDGTALVIVIWIALGLVSIALYFGNSCALELKAADNRVAAVEAEHALDGAARYAMYVLTNTDQPGVLPDPVTYLREAVPVGDARFWFVGRDTRSAQPAPEKAFFGLVDECSKLNLNTATLAMLTNLPHVTPEFAAAIIDWRDTDSNVTDGGAEDDTYARLNPPYHCKNAPFDSVEELRLVVGADMEVLFGEDTNLNGVLDANENDGPTTLPVDNRDGRLDPGLLEYVTVYSSQPTTLPDGTAMVNVGGANALQGVASLLGDRLGTDRSNQILRNLGGGGGPGGGPGGNQGGNTPTFRSVLEFYIRSQMTANEFSQIETNLVATAAPQPGQTATANSPVNVNTASEAVLTCIPGIGLDYASQVVRFRQANSDRLNTVSWVSEILPRANAIQAGPYLAGRSYQFSADIVATGHLGRGFRRARYVIDISGSTARIVARRDLSHLGWALGRDAREQQRLLLTQNQR